MRCCGKSSRPEGAAGCGDASVGARGGNRGKGNAIGGNGEVGIGPGAHRVTASDAGDGDTGANGLQSFPVLASAISEGRPRAPSRGALSSAAADSQCREVFPSAGGKASGCGEGARLLAALEVKTHGMANVSCATTLSCPSHNIAPRTISASVLNGAAAGQRVGAHHCVGTFGQRPAGAAAHPARGDPRRPGADVLHLFDPAPPCVWALGVAPPNRGAICDNARPLAGAPRARGSDFHTDPGTPCQH